MPIVEAKEDVATIFGKGVVVESDLPIDLSTCGGSVVLRHATDKPEYARKVYVRTTGNYLGGSPGQVLGWQVALNKDQMLCLARALIKMAGEL